VGRIEGLGGRGGRAWWEKWKAQVEGEEGSGGMDRGPS
jgi:hypothetical protein